VYDQRNLIVATGLPVLARRQLRNDLVAAPTYLRLTAMPPDTQPIQIGVERPILHVQLDLGDGRSLHVVNVHLKSKIPTPIPGQMIDTYTWRSADAWAKGAFISAMKRMAQALEARRLVDEILDADPAARIVVAGDFNATPDEVPVLAIRGNVEDTGNGDLAARVLAPIEHTIAEPARYTLYHQGKGEMLDHMLVTRNLLAYYRGSEIHNEVLHDESASFATDRKYPSPTTHPWSRRSNSISTPSWAKPMPLEPSGCEARALLARSPSRAVTKNASTSGPAPHGRQVRSGRRNRYPAQLPLSFVLSLADHGEMPGYAEQSLQYKCASVTPCHCGAKRSGGHATREPSSGKR
jgi:hypothetical protein